MAMQPSSWELIKEFAAAHGFDASDVEEVTVTPEKARFTLFERDESGFKASEGGEPVRTVREVWRRGR